MKKILILFVAFFLTGFIFGQPWKENLPKDKLEAGTLTFRDFQKAFNDYWPPFNVVRGSYMKDGVKTKANGWKQFKRWEWYWQNRVDKSTGAFPHTSAYEEFIKTNSTTYSPKSASGAWSSLGPYSSAGGYAGLGRVNCVACIPGDNNTIYIGSPSGGIWRTTDAGGTWTPLGDYNPVLGVSDIVAYRPGSGPDVLYIATGDRDGGSMWSLGGGQYNDNNSVGILKSTDGGSSWSTTGLTFTASQQRTVNRLLILPGDNNTLYAATSAGLYKTTDGGTTWNQIVTTVFIDMEFKPGTPSVMYASNKNGDVYLSTNGGTTWLKTLSTTDYRTEIAVTPADPTVVYAVIANSSGGLATIYKSANSGSSYTSVFSGATTNILNGDCNSTTAGGQGSYDLCIAADPTNANVVYIGGVNTWKSTTGGISWSICTAWTSGLGCGVPEVHADKHCLVFQNGTSVLLEGNDGGLYKTTNGGTSYSYIGSGVATSQIYKIGLSQTAGNEYMSGLQDNGTKECTSGNWQDVIGGDGFECVIDYTNVNNRYGEYVNGDIKRSTDHGTTWTNISTGLTGSGAWCTPFALDPAVNTTIYVGYQDVFKSINQGTTWTKLSNWGGDALQSLTVAPSNSNYIYAATLSILYGTTNGGSTWLDITGTLPVASCNITYVSVKNDDPNTIWVSLGEYNATKVFQTTNGGATWNDISAGLPSIPVMCVIQNKLKSPVIELYAGTDVGVYVKNGSSPWTLFSTGLPNVVVAELEIFYGNGLAPDKLRAGTFGRGLWESDLLETGILNPTSIKGNAVNTNEIDLTWTKNTGNNPVMLAYSTSPTFGSPVNGTTYNAGASIPGGGTVIYNGTGTAFNQTSLTGSTTYYYKIWSYDGTNQYSSGAITSATTFCTLIATFPWSEGFEHAGVLPTCWTQENVSGTNPWEMKTAGTNSHPAAAHTGTYLARCRTLTVNAGYITRFVSPPINLSPIQNPVLQFWHTQEYWAGQDELRVYYKTSTSGSWNLLATYTASIASWTQETIVLPNPTATYYLAFEGKVNAGYGICIDDVSILQSTPFVSTTAVTSVTTSTASSGGNVTAQGITSVTARGVCWSAAGVPTIGDSHTTDGSGTGVFPSSVTGLTPATTYNLRAYASNSYGTSYGSNVQFTTLAHTLNITLFLEGLYSGSSQMTAAKDESGPHFGSGIADKISIDLHDGSNYSTIVYSISNVTLNTNGTAIVTIPPAYTGNYYITIRHRNSIETTTAGPVSFSPGTVTYLFDAPGKAYGSNLQLMQDGKYALYSGDVNQDNIIDGGDMSGVDNLSAAFTSGYLPEDVNGDGLVDGSDLSIVDNNASAFIGISTP